MLIEKPEWFRHGSTDDPIGVPIYGVDIHPDETRFVSAGGDNMIKIWDLTSFEDDTIDNNVINNNKIDNNNILCIIQSHEQAVNCVRWSNNGIYLASGSVDQLVIIYKLLKLNSNSTTLFGVNEFKNKENWSQISILRGHIMDVQDIAWSPDDEMLASCSIDNKIFIWKIDENINNISNNILPFKVLTAHIGWVKGIAWDPVGNYLASAGEDRSIIIWRVDDWQIEKKISEPFENCSSTSHFRRISWSPDGSSICGTHGFKSKKYVAALLDRNDDWKNKIDFVGHTSPVTCSRFNPRFLYNKNITKDTSNIDNNNINNINDNSHSICVAVAGEDCTVSVWITSVERPLMIVTKCFENAITDLTWGKKNGNILLISSLDGTIAIFKLEEKEIGKIVSLHDQDRLMEKMYGKSVGNTGSSTFIENIHQLEFEEANIQDALDKNNDLSINNSKRKNPNISTDDNIINKLAPRKKTEIRSELKDTNYTKTVSNSVPNLLMARSKSIQNNPNKKPKIHNQDKTISINKDTINNNKNHINILDNNNNYNNKEYIVANIIPSPPLKSKIIFQDKSNNNFNNLNHTNKIIECIIQKYEDTSEHGMVYSIIKSSTIESNKENNKGKYINWMDCFPNQVTIIKGNENYYSFALHDTSLYILSKEGIRCFPPITLGSEICMMEWSPLKTNFLMVLLKDNTLKIWNIKKKLNILNNSIQTIIMSISNQNDNKNKKISVFRIQLTDSGQPLISFSIICTNKNDNTKSNYLESYTFDINMQIWFRVGDNSFSYSDFNTILPIELFNSSNIPIGPLKQLQNISCTVPIRNNIFIYNNNNIQLQRNITRSHLEHQIASSIILKSSNEYKYWMKTYINHLVMEEDIEKLREIFDELMGPLHANTNDTNSYDYWSPTILNINKRDFLKNEIVPLAGKNRNIQRFVNEIVTLLKEIK